MTVAEISSSSQRESRFDAAELRGVLGKMRSAARKNGAPDYDARIELLDKLEQAVLAKKHDLARAVSADFGNRSKHETFGAEIMVVVN